MFNSSISHSKNTSPTRATSSAEKRKDTEKTGNPAQPSDLHSHSQKLKEYSEHLSHLGTWQNRKAEKLELNGQLIQRQFDIQSLVKTPVHTMEQRQIFSHQQNIARIFQEKKDIENKISTFDSPPFPDSVVKELLHNAPQKYTLTSKMDSQYQGEHLPSFGSPGVHYLSEQERLMHLVTVTDGKLSLPNGKPLDTRDGMGGGSSPEYYIYAMDTRGNLFVNQHSTYKEFQHSSFLAGEDAACAGKIKTTANNDIEIDRDSGHYKPSIAQLDQVKKELESRQCGKVIVNYDY